MIAGKNEYKRQNVGTNVHAKCSPAFCDAGGQVMQHLSSTISLGDQTNAIVLPLHVYPFLLAISRLPSYLAWSKASSHPFLPPDLQDAPRLTPCFLSLWVQETGGMRPGRVGKVNNVWLQNSSTVFKHCFSNLRWGGILHQASFFTQTPRLSCERNKIRAHMRAVSAGVRMHHQRGSTFDILGC